MKTKLCKTCNRNLPTAKFSIATAQPDGLQTKCKECAKEYFKIWMKQPVKLKKKFDKKCKDCGLIKPSEDFYTDNSKKDKVRPICKDCFNARRFNKTPRPYQHTKEYLKNQSIILLNEIKKRLIYDEFLKIKEANNFTARLALMEFSEENRLIICEKLNCVMEIENEKL